MPSNEEIIAALRVLTHAYDARNEYDMSELTRAMLNAAEVVRLAKLERELAKMSNPDAAS